MAIKALEQTKNDLGVDAISRQEVLDLIADYDLSMGQVVRGIHALPSVTPQESFKPMVEIDLDYVIKQKYIERGVLDKIRAEISCNIIEDDTSGNTPAKLRADWAAANKAHMIDIAILDKYRGGSKLEDGNDE